MEVNKAEAEAQRRFLISGKGDTVLAIFLLLLVMLIGPILIELLTGSDGIGVALSGLAGEAAAYAIVLYGLIKWGFKAIEKYNQILAYTVIYVVFYIIFLFFNP